MTPEMERIIAQLGDWHARSVAATTEPEFIRLLGEAEAVVGHLLEQVAQEGASR